MSYETLTDILEHMKRNKWSADNVSFGSGGALLQKVNRDTQKCAYKCSYAIIDGKGVSLTQCIYYLKVTIICRYIFLRIELKWRFVRTKICDLYAELVRGRQY